jgi:hypothetical protein
MVDDYPQFEPLQRIAEVMELRLSKTNESKRGQVSGEVYVVVDSDRDAVAVCKTISDLSDEVRGLVEQFVQGPGPHRFHQAIEDESITWQELLDLAGHAHPAWKEKAEKRRLERTLPGARAQDRAKRL